MLDLHERRYATIGAAHEAGVPIYVGTDAGGSLPQVERAIGNCVEGIRRARDRKSVV